MQVKAALLLSFLFTLSGCAGLGVPRAIPPSPGQKRAERESRLLHEYEQKRDRAQLTAARLRLQQGDVSGARESLEALLARSAENRDARLLLADIYLSEGSPERAQAEIQSVLQRNPDDPAAQHALGLVLVQQDHPQEAAKHLHRATQLEPENELFALSYRVAQGEVPNAAESSPTQVNGGVPCLSCSPPGNQPRLPASRLNAAGRHGNNSAPHRRDAVHPLQTKRRDSTNPQQSALPTTAAEPVSHTATAPVESMPADEKAAFFRQLARDMSARPNDPQVPLGAGVQALQSRRADLAAAAAEAGIRHFPDSARLYRLYGLAHYRQGDYRSAHNALQKAAELDNADALSYFLLGLTQRRLGRLEAAAKSLATAERLDPSLPNRRR